MHQILFRPRPRWASSQCSPRSLDGFKGATSKRRQGRGRAKRTGIEGRRRNRRGRERRERGEEM